MERHISNARLLAAWAGLATLLSPLVGSAFATAGQIVNISDPSAAYTARVTSNGALKTNAVVSGKVAPALPPQPFSILRSTGLGSAKVLGPTTATIALSDVTFTNYFGNQARFLKLTQHSAPAPNTSCALPRNRTIGAYGVGSGQTLTAGFETPIVIEPLATGDAWCLYTSLGRPSGDSNDYVVQLLLGGYVLSGTFAS